MGPKHSCRLRPMECQNRPQTLLISGSTDSSAESHSARGRLRVSGHTGATAAPSLSSRSPPTRSAIENDAAPPAADPRPSTKRTTRAGTSWKQWRALATRYDILPLTYRGGTFFRAVSIWLAALGDTPQGLV
jgi:hypothetical protein